MENEAKRGGGEGAEEDAEGDLKVWSADFSRRLWFRVFRVFRGFLDRRVLAAKRHRERKRGGGEIAEEDAELDFESMER